MKDDKIQLVSDETRKAVEPIYREFYQQVFNYAKYVVKNHEDAEEVTSDVFAKIMNLYAKPETRFDEDKAALPTWVRTITNSVVLDFFRTNHQDQYKAVSDFVDGEGNDSFQFSSSMARSPEKIMVNNELRAGLDKAFGGLKPKYREIATLYFEREWSYEEISGWLNVPMGTVKGMISRARQKLQSDLDSLYDSKRVVGAMSDA